MTRTALLCCALVLLTRTAAADVTIEMTTRGAGASAPGSTTLRIKGHRLRTDVRSGTGVQTMIFDVDAGLIFNFSSTQEQADEWSMPALARALDQQGATGPVTAALTPNRQSKPLDGGVAAGYDFALALSAPLPGDASQRLQVTLEGPVWIVPDAAGAADFRRFYAATAPGAWIFSDPRSALRQPGPARAIAEMQRRLAATGGIPYATDVQIRMAGPDAWREALARIGPLSLSTAVRTVSTDPLADELFRPPAGYAVTRRN